MQCEIPLVFLCLGLKKRLSYCYTMSNNNRLNHLEDP
jgi:hypothetical protein